MKCNLLSTFNQAAVVALLACPAFAGEPNPPPTQPTPTVPRTVVTATVNPNQSKMALELAETRRLVADLQGNDASKHAAAEAGLVAKGIIGYNMVASTLNNPDAAVKQRAVNVREKVLKRTNEMVEEAKALELKIQANPLNAADLELMQKLYSAIATYAPTQDFRQGAAQKAQIAQAMLNDFKTNTANLAEYEKALTATPPPVPLRRAALLLDRAQAYITLQRPDDALKAATEGLEASGKTGRFSPAALKILSDLYGGKNDLANQERVSKQILSDYPDSSEARTALATLVEINGSQQRWDAAVEAAKNFVNACPLEDDAQEAIYGVLDVLSEKVHDYPRAYGLAGWIKGRFPASRVKPDVIKLLAVTSEYAMKDYATAESTYKLIAEQYNDTIPAAETDAARARVHAKAAGTFPKEPTPKDEGPAGAFAQFLAAVRTQDSKALEAAVPAADKVQMTTNLTATENDFVASIVFANFIVKNVAIDGDKATLTLDYYDSASNTPRPLPEMAIREEGAWKMKWKIPEDVFNPEAAKKRAEAGK